MGDKTLCAGRKEEKKGDELMNDEKFCVYVAESLRGVFAALGDHFAHYL